MLGNTKNTQLLASYGDRLRPITIHVFPGLRNGQLGVAQVSAFGFLPRTVTFPSD